MKTAHIRTAKELGELIRRVRQAQKLKQIDLATASGTGERFIVDLERGKPTCELDKALRVARMLGIGVELRLPVEIANE